MRNTGRTSEPDVGDLVELWREYSTEFGEGIISEYSRTKIYDTSVCPGPWWGDLTGARVYFLFLNPTTEWVKWDGAPKGVIDNLLLEDRRFPQLLDPSLPGHRRWTTFLRPLGLTNDFLAEKVCVVNLLPWASDHFVDHVGVFDNPVTEKVRRIVGSLVSDKSKFFVVCRRPEVWGVDPYSNVFVFPPIMRRGVHIRQRGLDLVPTLLEYLK